MFTFHLIITSRTGSMDFLRRYSYDATPRVHMNLFDNNLLFWLLYFFLYAPPEWCRIDKCETFIIDTVIYLMGPIRLRPWGPLGPIYLDVAQRRNVGRGSTCNGLTDWWILPILGDFSQDREKLDGGTHDQFF